MILACIGDHSRVVSWWLVRLPRWPRRRRDGLIAGIRADNNGTLEYIPTKREIAAKCRLCRTIDGWQGAGKWMPRDGEYAVASTAGL